MHFPLNLGSWLLSILSSSGIHSGAVADFIGKQGVNPYWHNIAAAYSDD